LAGSDRRDLIARSKPCWSAERRAAPAPRGTAVHASEALVAYVQALMARSRHHPGVRVGLSPRAGLALLRAARAHALLLGRAHALPEDVQALFISVAAHRLVGDADSGDGATLREVDPACGGGGLMMCPATPPFPARTMVRDAHDQRRSAHLDRTRAAKWITPRAPEPLPVRFDRSRVYVLPTGLRPVLQRLLLWRCCWAR
jgi:hypothetical protein